MDGELDFQNHHPLIPHSHSLSCRVRARVHVNIHWHDIPVHFPPIYFIQFLTVIKINSSAKFIKIWTTHSQWCDSISKFKLMGVWTENRFLCGKIPLKLRHKATKFIVGRWSSIQFHCYPQNQSLISLHKCTQTDTHTHRERHTNAVFLFWFVRVINVYTMWLVYNALGARISSPLFFAQQNCEFMCK